MAETYEIRASFDQENIAVYQAYPDAIADAALSAQKFVAPFSLGRMTWIKPSFLWLMNRSNWGSKGGQERTLAVTISRNGWERALSRAVLTAYASSAHKSKADWDEQFSSALVHVQWDPERSMRGAALAYDSIQVGISRHIIEEFVDSWTVKIEDITPMVSKMRKLMKDGKSNEAKRYLPKERVYSIPSDIGQRLMIKC